MNRLHLNNEIVSMRKYVKQTRVHVANKLVQKVRILHKKNGTDEMKQKFQEKANRLVEEILALKTLNDDDISKFALLGSQLPAENFATDPQRRILIKIASYKVLANQVMKFQEKWPDWCETVPKLLSDFKIEIFHANKSKTSNVNVKTGVSRKKKVSSKTSAFIDSVVGKKQVSIVGKSDVMNINKSRRTSYTAVDFVDTNVVKKEKNTQKDHKSPSLPVLVKDSLPAVVDDPFFMGLEDDVQTVNFVNYETLRNKPVYDDGLNRAERRKVMGISNRNNKSFKVLGKNMKNRKAEHPFDHRIARHDRLRNAAASVPHHPSQEARKYVKGQRTFHQPKESKNCVQEQQSCQLYKNHVQEQQLLHPSWEAKKRLQEQQKLTVPFQGKKIKFDNDE